MFMPGMNAFHTATSERAGEDGSGTGTGTGTTDMRNGEKKEEKRAGNMRRETCATIEMTGEDPMTEAEDFADGLMA